MKIKPENSSRWNPALAPELIAAAAHLFRALPYSESIKIIGGEYWSEWEIYHETGEIVVEDSVAGREILRMPWPEESQHGG
ncbi:hypothetical protein HFU84_13110 [Acidithiobacillus sp. CV18-2]|nr:hypothetical protein [Acidithiobacillus sp. CV18-3]MBU2758460.1 hypothetical protein [Acidithiobacillus sp. BN09-2]MBU2778416.1 hypothetical protein [Acidithiobacillus sp. CV18-2]MBU2798240.1 hypothetical protein [Acidithiobacillus sp. VAN18-4]